MSAIKEKRWKRQRRHFRVRRKVTGTPERPRLAVHRTLKHIYAQVIDDVAGRTLCSVSSRGKELADLSSKGNAEAAKKVGALIAERAKAAGITKVVFDRGGCIYHGRVKALADAAREAGLGF